MLSAADRELVHAFETCALPAGGFPHRQHVRAAWAMLRLLPASRAMPRFRASLRRFARHNNAPRLYHETITMAFLFAIHERIQALGEEHGWQEFAAANPDLVADGKAFLAGYYSRERLDCELARHHFLLPDRPRPPAGSDG